MRGKSASTRCGGLSILLLVFHTTQHRRCTYHQQSERLKRASGFSTTSSGSRTRLNRLVSLERSNGAFEALATYSSSLGIFSWSPGGTGRRSNLPRPHAIRTPIRYQLHNRAKYNSASLLRRAAASNRILEILRRRVSFGRSSRRYSRLENVDVLLASPAPASTSAPLKMNHFNWSVETA